MNTQNLPDFDNLWDYNNPAKTATLFLEILSKAEQADHDEYRGELLTQIARCQGLLGKFEKAGEFLQKVEKEGLSDRFPKVMVRLLLEKGRIFNSSQKPDLAAPLFEEAFSIAFSLNLEHLAIDAAHMIAIVSEEEQINHWNLKALEICEQSNDKKAKSWAGSLYNNIAWYHHDKGEFEQALNRFHQALRFFIDAKNPNGMFIASWCVGRTLRSLRRLEEALAVQLSLLGEIEAGTMPPDGFVYEEVAECFLALGNNAEAKKHFQAAYRLLANDPWFAAHEPDRLNRMKQIAWGA